MVDILSIIATFGTKLIKVIVYKYLLYIIIFLTIVIHNIIQYSLIKRGEYVTNYETWRWLNGKNWGKTKY